MIFEKKTKALRRYYSQAACDLLTDLKTKIVECFVIIELVDLKGRDKIKDVTSVQALFQY